jgi:glutathione peroxidase-family protein
MFGHQKNPINSFHSEKKCVPLFIIFLINRAIGNRGFGKVYILIYRSYILIFSDPIIQNLSEIKWNYEKLVMRAQGNGLNKNWLA